MNAYEIQIKKDPDGVSTDVSLKWVYGEPHENLLIEQLFEGDSITFKELQALIDALDYAVKKNKEHLA